MTSFLDRLNLRPAERRLVVGVAVVLFIVLNAFLVWPHFKDWGRVRTQFYDAQKKLATYQQQAKQIDEYKKQVKTLEGASGEVLAEDQDIQLKRTIDALAAECGVNITQTPRPTTQTNEFFLEQVQQLSVQAGEEQLVNFLFKLGSGNSLIRVRQLSLRPEQMRQQLGGGITLVASFSRKSAGPPAAPANRTATARPAPAKR